MDDDKQPNVQHTDEDSSGSVDITEDIKKAYAYIEIIQNKLSGCKPAQDGAGPSTILPGTVQCPKNYLPKPGQSKSEHNIRHIITTNDVEKALKLTSLSFGPLQQEDKKINFKDIKIPPALIESTKVDAKEDLKAFADIKSLMVACIKKQGLNLSEVSNVQTVNTALSNINMAPESIVTANVLTTSNAQTDMPPPLLVNANEVLITGRLIVLCRHSVIILLVAILLIRKNRVVYQNIPIWLRT